MTTSDPSSIVAATYNIRLGIQEGLEAVAEALRERDRIDILAVQEVGQHWTMGPEGDSAAHLSELLDFDHFQFVPTIEEPRDDGPPARYGHALLSRWPIEGATIIALPRRDDEPRALLRCTIDAPSTSIEVLSTHLSHLPSDRPDQGAFLIEYLQKNPPLDGARFLFGDLNAPSSEPWMPAFLSHWTDADAEKQRPTFPAHKPEQRIDYVLAQSATRLSTDVPKLSRASDHRPVLSQWRLAPR